MNKNSIKKYAVWARRELIERVSQKALQYGITLDEVIDSNADSIYGKLLSPNEKKQRQALIHEIDVKGYEEVVEEVAYTWFNRFSALRFMEVNGYLPSHVRIFTDEGNNFKPQIIDEVIHMELTGLNMEKVFFYKEANLTEELYKYLLITQCNALNEILPGMFQKIDDYTELLLPDNLLRKGSVIYQMIEIIPEDDWRDTIQIIGWLFQYYNAEKKDEVFSSRKKGLKISKEDIPAATQIFTPDWIVRYIVENSLGRLWLQGHPDENLKSSWKYYLDEDDQNLDVKKQLLKVNNVYAEVNVKDLKAIDPFCGSGHILAYLFDVFFQIYKVNGYTAKDAVSSILENNIYGLDVDDRAVQMAYFVIMMKSRQYDNRFFFHTKQPNIYAIQESNDINRQHLKYIDGQLHNDIIKQLISILDTFVDAKEYGSLIEIPLYDWEALKLFIKDKMINLQLEIDSIGIEKTIEKIDELLEVSKILTEKYNVVVTNPPYAAAKGLNYKLHSYLSDRYKTGKYDLFGASIIKCIHLALNYGKIGLVTPVGVMYNPSFATLREDLFNEGEIESLVEIGNDGFDEGFGTASYIISKNKIHGYIGQYYDVSKQKIKENFKNERKYLSSTKYFEKFDFCKVMYKLTKNYRKIIETAESLCEIGEPRIGMQTNDNNRFLRLWHEVDKDKICICHKKGQEFDDRKWYPMVKGGGYRKWYGNIDNVVNWQYDGKEIRELNKNASGGRIVAEEFYFCEGISWTHTTYGQPFSARFMPEGTIINVEGPAIFSLQSKQNYVMGCLNSKVGKDVFKKVVSSIHYSANELGKFPLLIEENTDINTIVSECIDISKADWDTFERSWDFKRHPFLFEYEQHDIENSQSAYMSEIFDNLKQIYNDRFEKIKNNEERLNRIFIEIYGLQDELTPTIEDSEVTVYNLFDNKKNIPKTLSSSNYVLTKRDMVISFISYAVGCMFGRYSLEKKGINYAGGKWSDKNDSIFPLDKDNIIPICDDEYFDDDIVGQFIQFLKVLYGKESLEKNIKFIADALDGKGQPKEVIRGYFLKSFFKDHCMTYKKRPIYWLFDSGKKNGFKALVYMHRYQPDTIARIRTDYVHEQQSRYRTAIAEIENRIADTSTSERVKLNKTLKKLQDQAEEIRIYEEKVHHLADQMISIDLDDGVKHNYEIFKDVLAKI